MCARMIAVESDHANDTYRKFTQLRCSSCLGAILCVLIPNKHLRRTADRRHSKLEFRSTDSLFAIAIPRKLKFDYIIRRLAP